MQKTKLWYFSHDFHARNDRKLQALMFDHGLKGIGAYWCILEMLYEDGGRMPTHYERIARSLHAIDDVKMIEDVITKYELFTVNCTTFWSESALTRLKHINIKSCKAKASAKRRWDANALRPLCERNANKEEKRREEKSKEDNKKITVPPAHKNTVFIPPTKEELMAYNQEANLRIDCLKFLDFYESKGWVVGRVKMKDWRSAARNWARNQQQMSFIPSKGGSGKGLSPELEEALCKLK